MPGLAIVIPAYKSEFLQQTLESLAVQTNKDFAVYIGNDGGDAAIEKIVTAFNDRLPITYRSFSQNLGNASLVKQWERCFALTQQEEWLWLLPDDDYADPECVELFYRHLQQHDFDVFRFNVKFVTAEKTVFKTNTPLPPVQSAWDSLMEKLSFYRPSTVAEFIFNKQQFGQTGFTEIPLAWGSDDLLWFLMGNGKGIYGTNDAFVYLRQSHLNISNNYGNLGKEKIASNFIFFEKLLKTPDFQREVKEAEKRKQFNLIAVKHILHNLQNFSLSLSFRDMLSYSVRGNAIWGGGIVRNMRRFYLNNRRINNIIHSAKQDA